MKKASPSKKCSRMWNAAVNISSSTCSGHMRTSPSGDDVNFGCSILHATSDLRRAIPRSEKAPEVFDGSLYTNINIYIYIYLHTYILYIYILVYQYIQNDQQPASVSKTRSPPQRHRCPKWRNVHPSCGRRPSRRRHLGCEGWITCCTTFWGHENRIYDKCVPKEIIMDKYG